MNTDSLLVGWREWAGLLDFDVPLIKVKIDTGAKTSALHAYDIKIVRLNNKECAEFIIHPIQNNDKVCRKAVAEIVGMRTVKSSNGHKENRIVIRSPIKIGKCIWDIDITLTNRDIMHHRMLLGRAAMTNVLVDPTKSYCQGVISDQQAVLTYEPVILE